MTVNLIKQKYKGLTGQLTADERVVRRAAFREESVRVILKTTGMLPGGDEVIEPFSSLFQAVEATLPTVDRSQLAELAEAHEAHPAIRVMDSLRTSSAIPKEDIVAMTCVSLILIDQATLA